MSLFFTEYNHIPLKAKLRFGYQCLKDLPIKHLPTIFFCFLFVIGVLFSPYSSAESIDRNKLLKIEAAYLYKFTKFIEWPDSLFEQSSNLNICLLGKNLSQLNRLLTNGVSGKQSNGKTLQIYHYQTTLPSSSSPKCHLIYLDNVSANTISSELDSSQTLLISSPNNQHKIESLIYLEILEGKLVFFINQKLLENSRLEINAALLSLARKKL